MGLNFPFLCHNYLFTNNTNAMTNTAIKNISSISEIMKILYEERNFKDINLKVFSDGVGYIANKLMCFNGIRSGYFIMLNN